MKRLVAALFLSAVAAGAQAHDRKNLQCDVDSDYAMRMQGKAFIFTRDHGPARHVAIGGGRLFVDGKEVALSVEDRERVRRYEGELNRLVPQMQHVVYEATDIAFSALTEVARGFAADGSKATLARLETAHARVKADLKREPIVLFSDEDIVDRIVEPVVEEYVPVIVGNAVSSTLSVVFSGDEKKAHDFERRMERMGDEIERKVEKRAEALEPMVESMCKRTRELDRIESGLALRLADGGRLDLLTARVGTDAH
jgi:hypothetical protein